MMLKILNPRIWVVISQQMTTSLNPGQIWRNLVVKVAALFQAFTKDLKPNKIPATKFMARKNKK